MPSYHVMSCHLTSSYVLSYHVMSCHVMSCHDTPESCSRIFLPSLLNSSRAAGWQRRGFRNRGPVRESGSERRSRCGAACVASVSRGRHGEWCDLAIVLRGRLRGSGVSSVCRGRAGGRAGGAVPRGLASGRVACTHDLRAVTCVSRGRRGTPDACPRAGRHWRVDPRGRCGETCIWTLVRVLFTWQVWGKVAIGGVAKVDSRGRRGEARTQRAFRVAGVGNGASGGLAEHSFAWQAQGIVRGS